MEFSHKWANQVLTDRGFPSPGLACLQSFIEDADVNNRRRMYGVLQSIERGTEAVVEADWLMDILREAKANHESCKPNADVIHETTNHPSCVVPPLVLEQALTRKVRRTDTKQLRAKHHVYGLKGALTLEMDELRSRGDDEFMQQTVILEAAIAVAHRTYDWANKISFQFMRRELPLLACALFGMLDGPLELGNHGQAANKFVVIADQGEKLFVQVKQGAKMVAVPVGPADVHAWIELVMRALKANTPDMGDAIQLTSLHRVAAMEKRRTSSKQAR